MKLPVFNLSFKFCAKIFIYDRYMATLRLCGFGCEMPIRANFGEFFWGILTPKIVKLLFRPPQVRTSHGDAPFEVLCVKIGSAVSSVGLFEKKASQQSSVEL